MLGICSRGLGQYAGCSVGGIYPLTCTHTQSGPHTSQQEPMFSLGRVWRSYIWPVFTPIASPLMMSSSVWLPKKLESNNFITRNFIIIRDCTVLKNTSGSLPATVLMIPRNYSECGVNRELLEMRKGKFILTEFEGYCFLQILQQNRNQ